MISSRLPAVAAAAVAALLLTSCTTDDQQAVGIDALSVAVIGAVAPDQQAFIERLTALSEGSISVDLQENWRPSEGSGNAEEALVQAVEAGDVDVAWVTLRSVSAIGVTGADALETPLLIQTHAQQREVATGVVGELIMRQFNETNVEALALLPGPEQFPVANGAAILDVADWSGKTVEYASGANAESIAALTFQALGATHVAEGTTPVADVLAGSVQAATANPADMVAGGATKAGPFLTANLPLWPKMSAIVINRDVAARLSTRQSGFIDGSVVRAQDVAMTAPDITTVVSDACSAGVRFGVASADQVDALKAAVQPIYDKVAQDTQEGKIFEAIQDAVARTVGNGSFPVSKSCRWKAPDS